MTLKGKSEGGISNQAFPTKSPSEADSLDCSGYVSLDNPLYDKGFEVILAGQGEKRHDESHPMAQTGLTIEVAEINMNEVPTRLNAQQLDFRSIKEKTKYGTLKGGIPKEIVSPFLAANNTTSVEVGGSLLIW